MPNNFIPYMTFMSISIFMPIDKYYLLNRHFYACYICTGPLDNLSKTFFLTSVSHASRSASERTIRYGIETDCTSGCVFQLLRK